MDQAAMPPPKTSAPPGNGSGDGPSPGWSGTWALAAGGVLVVMILAGLVVWGVRASNRPFDDARLSIAGRSELTAAKVDHDVIVAAANQCAVGGNTAPAPVPKFLLTMAPDDTRDTAALSAPQPPLPADRQMALPKSSYISVALVMSHHIGWARVRLAEQEWWSNVSMQVFQWAVVVIGAITTVLISIKAVSHERSDFTFGVGIAAIIFSTLGTAIGTMNSFYAPRVAHDRDERSLQTLQTLHLELATGITRESALCDPLGWPPDWRYKRIRTIEDQYVQAMNTAQVPTDSTEEGGSTAPNTGSSTSVPPKPDSARPK